MAYPDDPLHLAVSDVDAPVANAAPVRDALNSKYEQRQVVPVDLSTASGLMAVYYDANLAKARLQPLLPIVTSAQATGAGRLLVANGANYEDMVCEVMLAGAGAPADSLGWDGAVYRNTTTGRIHGRRTGGAWPADTKGWITYHEGTDAAERALLGASVDLGGQLGGNDTIWGGVQPGGEPVGLIYFTNYAAVGTASASDGWIGLDVQVGTNTIGAVVLKPRSSIADADILVEGKGTGRAKRTNGEIYLTAPDIAAWAFLRAPATVNGVVLPNQSTTALSALVMVVGVDEPTRIAATDKQGGDWDESAFVSTTNGGHVVPEAGSYIVDCDLSIRNSSTDTAGVVTLEVIKNGSALTVPCTRSGEIKHNTTGTIRVTSAPIACAADDELGVVARANVGTMLCSNWGQILITRTA